MIGGDIWWEALELCVVDGVELLEIKEFLMDGRERVGECGKFVESKGLEEDIDELGVTALQLCLEPLYTNGPVDICSIHKDKEG
ncbi:hypothetical protein OUZ56_012242 [Daphnia magna]|uniref:Uncharacterized protein n=1 Tax=Daphnia magna TaxID=35525 RepID=A0ABQ9Z2R0_9CRUS|nr:hypothetical protein OUZ56_012242 [Daphnia magna]